MPQECSVEKRNRNAAAEALGVRKGHDGEKWSLVSRPVTRILMSCAITLPALFAGGCVRSETRPPTSTRVARAISKSPGHSEESTQARLSADLERKIREHFGQFAGTVEVSRSAVGTRDRFAPPGVVGAEHPYVVHGVYTLRGLPLTFPFTVNPGTSDLTHATDGGYLDRTLLHKELGGVARFYKLVRRYHLDFPNEPTMSYWLASDNQVDERPPYSTLLKGHPGTAAIVYKFDDYWIDGMAPQLGLYWWNPRTENWVPIHKGFLPRY